MMKTLVLDNYDSFTYNLVQMIEQVTGLRPDVYRNDKITLAEVGVYDKIVLSPGPGIPAEAGILCDLIREYAATKSILGVCLGQQAIAEVFGATLVNLSEIFHGVATAATSCVSEAPLLRGLPAEIEVGRYHSWAVSELDFPEELLITSRDANGIIMSLQHRTYDVHGVQYHPESILTPNGRKILENFFGASMPQ